MKISNSGRNHVKHILIVQNSLIGSVNSFYGFTSRVDHQFTHGHLLEEIEESRREIAMLQLKLREHIEYLKWRRLIDGVVVRIFF